MASMLSGEECGFGTPCGRLLECSTVCVCLPSYTAAETQQQAWSHCSALPLRLVPLFSPVAAATTDCCRSVSCSQQQLDLVRHQLPAVQGLRQMPAHSGLVRQDSRRGTTQPPSSCSSGLGKPSAAQPSPGAATQTSLQRPVQSENEGGG